MSGHYRQALTPRGKWLVHFSVLSTHISLKTWGHRSLRPAPWQAACVWHVTCVCSLGKIRSRFHSHHSKHWKRGPSVTLQQLPAVIREAQHGTGGQAFFFFSSQIVVCLFSNSYWYFQMAVTKWQVSFRWLSKMKLVKFEAIIPFLNSKRKPAL